jgi:DNA-binding XRE family transcriptional regulator
MTFATVGRDPEYCALSDICATCDSLRQQLAEALADRPRLSLPPGGPQQPPAEQPAPEREACPDCSWRARLVTEFAGRLRGALHLTQREVAARAGMSQSRISLLERGDVVPTEAECIQLAEALTLPPGTTRLPCRRRAVAGPFQRVRGPSGARAESPAEG